MFTADLKLETHRSNSEDRRALVLNHLELKRGVYDPTVNVVVALKL